MEEIKQIFVWIEKSITLKDNKNDPSCKARTTSLPIQNRGLQATVNSIKGKEAVVVPLMATMI